ncbi:DNA lyase [Lysobacter sp. Root494]|nr:DNA lyase [Lysobacter sp. Root494]
MRLWTLHPKYLDPQGLVALWREALLAKAVLLRETRGYRHHPQLVRFQAHAAPGSAINAYLAAIHDEAGARGYSFDRTKIAPRRNVAHIAVTDSQVACEWAHLMDKLQSRSPAVFESWQGAIQPELHPLFSLRRGPVEDWERMHHPPASTR